MYALRLRASNPAAVHCSCDENGTLSVSSCRQLTLRLPTRRHFASFTAQSLENASSEPSDSSRFISTVGFSSALHLSPSAITHRHIQVLGFFACAVLDLVRTEKKGTRIILEAYLKAAISATWLFCSAIPTLLAFKRAAESLEKLMDATREELPDTMAAVRLSGMEISDLTMELSDLGQEITQGVRSSTRAIRLAEERLRWLSNMNPIVSVQEVAPTKPQIADPVLARNARSIREGIVKGRAVLQMFFILTRYFKTMLKYLTSRAKS